MNWLDVVLIIMGVLALFLGLRMGLFHTVLFFGGLVIALVLAAQISGPLAGLFTNSVKSEATAAAIAYAIVFVAVFAAGQILAMMLRSLAKAVHLGWVDTLGGSALGLAGGVLLGLGLIVLLARVTYLIPEGGKGIASQTEARHNLEKVLLGSGLVPYYLDLKDALPGNAIGMVPGGFNQASNELKQHVDEKD